MNYLFVFETESHSAVQAALELAVRPYTHSNASDSGSWNLGIQNYVITANSRVEQVNQI